MDSPSSLRDPLAEASTNLAWDADTQAKLVIDDDSSSNGKARQIVGWALLPCLMVWGLSLLVFGSRQAAIPGLGCCVLSYVLVAANGAFFNKSRLSNKLHLQLRIARTAFFWLSVLAVWLFTLIWTQI